MENAGPGSQGPESLSVENTGSSGKHKIWWKTQGLSEKHWGTIFWSKYEFPSLKPEVEILLF